MTTRYVAGWNAPGKAPTAQPAEFADIGDAVAHLVRTVERLWDGDYHRHAGTGERLDIDGVWLPVHAALTYVSVGDNFHELTGDGRFEFWIRALDAPLTTSDVVREAT
ncbi:hypothetical protein [Actinopolymorpha sp. B9G3]|uniref:hypothetical protein n=1 Tax=Actinopolymorpha sp. B9G3 TaxID=3158970 RepID=UPI0032D91EB8